MRKTIFGCLGVAAVAFALQFTQADVQAALFSACGPCDEVGICDDGTCDPCDAVCGVKAGKWFLHGHMEAGFYANDQGYTNNYEDGIMGNSGLLLNTRLTGAQVNQTYLSFGKSVDGKRGLDIGGLVDFTWGSDAHMVQTAGLEYGAGKGAWNQGDYSTAIAQAYAEIAYKRWNVKIGKFYAPFGSSPYKSTDNFFYSWASTASIAPFVAGGTYATYKVSDKVSVLGGWVMPNEIGESSKHNDVLGGVMWSSSNKRLSLLYVVAAGKNKYVETPYDEFVQSLITTTQITKKLKYVFDWTLINVNIEDAHTAAYGFNNEIIYQYNKKWAFGTRFGMLNANEAYNATFVDPPTGALPVGDWYTVALGANWTPNKWLTVKPEIRYDWTKNKESAAFNGGTDYKQFAGGMSAIVKF